MRHALYALPLFALVACEPAEEADEPDAIEVNPSEVMTEAELYMIHLTPSAEPYTAGEEASLMLHVMVDGAGVEGARVTVEPFMPDMGHGLPDDPVVTGGDMGMFTAAWTFSMPGYWEVELMVDGSEGMDHATVAYEVQ